MRNSARRSGIVALPLLFLAVGCAGSIQSSGPDTPEAERGAGEGSTGSLPWEDLAGLIVERMDLNRGEQVLVLGVPDRFEAMVPPLERAIRQTGAMYLGALPTSGYANPVAGSDFVERLWERRVALPQEFFREADVVVILPGAGGPEYRAVQAALREGRGRSVHCHWAGALDLDGRAVPVTDAVDGVYLRAPLETDYRALAALQREFEAALRQGEVRVTTPSGTDLRFAVGDRPVIRQDGDASARRASEARTLIDREVELPAGVVRVAPLESTVYGKLVVPVSHWSGHEVRGLRMHFEGGVATRVEAESGLEQVLQELARAGEAGRAFREFALGFNPLLAIPEHEDWIPYYGYGAGVVRLALGDNTELGGAVGGGYARGNFFPDASVRVAGELWVRDGELLRLPTTRTVSFTTDECSYCAFDISPDGRWIVFDLLGQLWRIPAEGGEAVALTDAVGDVAEDRDPSYSPDGTWILFQGERGGQSALWIVPAAGGAPTPLNGTELPGSPRNRPYVKAAWSPDGERVLYSTGDTFRIHHLANSATRPAASWDGGGQPVSDAVWLPGSDRIIYRRGHVLSVGEFGVGPIGMEAALHLGDPVAGTSTRLVPAERGALSPAPSRDGGRVAFFAPDQDGLIQLWTLSLETGRLQQLTRRAAVSPLRVRWTPDDAALLYSAAGRLWRVAAEGGEPVEIPFQAQVTFQRREVHAPLSLPGPDAERTARGHAGVALAPDGRQLALIALGRLWLWRPGAEPRALASLPPTATGLSWSPHGRELAWTAGPLGEEDLFATAVATGHTRRLTALPGGADQAEWSPDGRHLAFVRYRGYGRPPVLAVVRDAGEVVTDTVMLVVPGPIGRQFGSFAWSPASDALLVYGDAPPRIVGLDGAIRPVRGLAHDISFLQWPSDTTLIFTRENLLHQARIRADSVTDVRPLSPAPAMYPVIAPGGTILFLSSDGYRRIDSDGSESTLGWPPLSKPVPVYPTLLIRNARVLQGPELVAAGPRDVLVESGRIARIAGAGSISPAAAERVIDAGGRTIMPGLIDLHHHVVEPLQLAGTLHWGITTALDMASPVARVAGFSESIAGGLIPGPRLLFGGLQFLPGGFSHAGSGPRMQAGGDAAARHRGLVLLSALGGSFAKMFTAQTLADGAEFIGQAASLGIRAGGHAPRFLPLAAAGVNDHQHLVTVPWAQHQLYDDLAALYAAAGIAVVPTFVLETTRSHLLADPAWLDQPAVAPFIAPAFRQMIHAIVEDCTGPWQGCPDEPEGLAAMLRMHRRGVRIGTGSDYSVVPVPGSLHWEMEALVRAGLAPVDALRAATIEAARVLGAEDEIGAIDVGKWADLILLDADPLEDIRNTRMIWKVIQDGRVVDLEALRRWAMESQRTEDRLPARAAWLRTVRTESRIDPK
jgi:Tol biopolymer transport system component